MIIPKLLREHNLLSNTTFYKVLVIISVVIVLSILPKIIFSIFGHELLFTLYNNKSGNQVESFYQIQKSFLTLCQSRLLTKSKIEHNLLR